MYGLVNRAIQELIQGRHGVATWQRIRERTGIKNCPFLSMQSYPDEDTVSLVTAAARELGITNDAFLEDFGRHWIDFATSHGYRDLLQSRGDSLFSFIARLNDLHTRLSLAFPALRPPSFHVDHVDNQTVRVHYRSEREGLSAFVVGLLYGMAERFGEKLVVVQDRRRADGADHDEFLLTVV